MARRPKYATTIDVSGPFFTKDPVKTFAANVQDMLESMAKEGEKDAEAQMGSLPDYQGWLTKTVTGRVHNKAGKHWRHLAVVSAYTKGMSTEHAIHTMLVASRLEGRWHVFRRVMSRLRKSRAVNMAELTKGM